MCFFWGNAGGDGYTRHKNSEKVISGWDYSLENRLQIFYLNITRYLCYDAQAFANEVSYPYLKCLTINLFLALPVCYDAVPDGPQPFRSYQCGMIRKAVQMPMYYYGSEAKFPAQEAISGESNSRKSLVSLYIYLMLRSESSENHPFDAEELLARLEDEQGIVMEKQAVVRAVKLLADSDIHVFYRARKGAWYDRRRLCA